jgi:hypothetical protein
MTAAQMEDADRMWHVRGNAYRTLPVGFVQRWRDDPETLFTIDLVSGQIYRGAKLVDVSDGPIWLDFEFASGARWQHPDHRGHVGGVAHHRGVMRELDALLCFSYVVL